MGTWGALLALAIQVAVVIAHVHPIGTAGRSDAASLAALAVDDLTVAKSKTSTDPLQPNSLAFDYCAICAVVNLAGALVPTAAPTWPAPAVTRQVRFNTARDAAATMPHRLFQARAPRLSVRSDDRLRAWPDVPHNATGAITCREFLRASSPT